MQEAISESEQSSSPLIFLIEVLFSCFEANVNEVRHSHNYLLGLWLVLVDQLSYGFLKRWGYKKNKDSKLSSQQSCSQDKKDDRKLSREEVEMVMGKLGLFCSKESEELMENMGSDELSKLFEEKEPSLEEVKEAFDVFDENKDGFIDAEELQRILLILGLKEGFVLQNCRIMIRTVDENGDGRIDFNEFVRFMERTAFVD